MKKLIIYILYPLLLAPILHANENFSVEIEALKLVMEKYKENAEANIEYLWTLSSKTLFKKQRR